MDNNKIASELVEMAEMVASNKIAANRFGLAVKIIGKINSAIAMLERSKKELYKDVDKVTMEDIDNDDVYGDVAAGVRKALFDVRENIEDVETVFDAINNYTRILEQEVSERFQSSHP